MSNNQVIALIVIWIGLAMIVAAVRDPVVAIIALIPGYWLSKWVIFINKQEDQLDE